MKFEIEREPVGPGEESVWDYPRPPRLEKRSEHIEIFAGGGHVFDTTEAYRVCETASPPTYYLPLTSFNDTNGWLVLFQEAASFCEWKGMATYWTIETPGGVFENCAWSYPDPNPAFSAIAGYLAVYPGRVDGCFIDGERVTPQPGEFYGGWITGRIKGPFKGEPGTRGW